LLHVGQTGTMPVVSCPEVPLAMEKFTARDVIQGIVTRPASKPPT
jgi:hypothetical protein